MQVAATTGLGYTNPSAVPADCIVSVDGRIVADRQLNLVGVIVDGVFTPVTQEIIDQVRQLGVLASEQP